MYWFSSFRRTNLQLFDSLSPTSVMLQYSAASMLYLGPNQQRYLDRSRWRLSSESVSSLQSGSSMDLILQKNDPYNTVFLSSEGLPLYQVDTPTAKLVSRSRTTAIQKITGSTSAQMATVELHAWKRDVVVVWDRDVTPSKPSKFLSAKYVYE